jgi:hypothetical protein
MGISLFKLLPALFLAITIKETVSPDIGVYFRLYKMKPVLSVGPLGDFKFFLLYSSYYIPYLF